MRLNITTITAIAFMALTSSHVIAQDIVVNYRTTDGKTESTTVDKERLPEIRKFMQAGIPLPAEQKRLLKSPAKSPDPGTETPEGFKVTFAVEDENPEGYTYEPWKVYVTQPDGEFGEGYYNYAYYPDEWMIEQGIDWWGCYITEGTYSLILATGRRYEDDSHLSAYIVKSNVKIDKDMTFTFRQSDAKNQLTAKFLYPDGSEMEELTKETSGHYNYGFHRCINSSKGDYCFNMTNMGGVHDAVYVNDLDETWTYAVNQVATTPDGVYVNKVIAPGPFSQDTEFTNNPEDYIATTAHFTPLPDTDMEINGYGVQSIMTWKGADWNAGTNALCLQDGPYTGEIKLFLNNCESDMSPSTGYDVLAAPVIVEQVIVRTEEWNGEIYEYKECISADGAYFMPRKDGGYLFIDSHDSYILPEYPREKFFLPSISPFNYCSDRIEFFNSAPIIFIDYLGSYYNNYMQRDMLDCYATSVYTTFEHYPYMALSQKVTNNDKSYLLNDNESFWDWSAAGNYVPGPVDLDFSAVYKSDNGKDYSTSASFSFDTTREKYCPPMVSRWQLRNGDNAPASTIGIDAVLLLDVTDSDLDENAIKCCYAASGTDDWNELTVQKTDDSGIYKAPVSILPPDGDESIYDLRFRLVDGHGNSAVQTIEGAMTCSSQSGISSTVVDNVDITVSGNSIIAPQGSEVYNVAGQRCPATGLQPGIYIVRTAGKSVKVVVK